MRFGERFKVRITENMQVWAVCTGRRGTSFRYRAYDPADFGDFPICGWCEPRDILVWPEKVMRIGPKREHIQTELLKTPGKTDCDLARGLGITHSYVAKVRRGLKIPPAKTAPNRFVPPSVTDTVLFGCPTSWLRLRYGWSRSVISRERQRRSQAALQRWAHALSA